MSHEQRQDKAAPEVTERSKRHVIIEVLGGVASVTSQPDDVTAEIIDRNNDSNNDNEMECDGTH